MLVTSPPRLSWRDALALRLLSLIGQNPPAAPDLRLPAGDGPALVDIGRRYPVRADRLPRLYRAAD